jgi:hypothetical protein
MARQVTPLHCLPRQRTSPGMRYLDTLDSMRTLNTRHLVAGTKCVTGVYSFDLCQHRYRLLQTNMERQLLPFHSLLHMSIDSVLCYQGRLPRTNITYRLSPLYSLLYQRNPNIRTLIHSLDTGHLIF